MTWVAEEVPLGSVTTWLSGGTPNRSNDAYWSGSIPWISATSLKGARIYDSDQRVTAEAVRAGSKMAPRGATLVLVRGMALHREIRAGLALRPVSFNQDVKALIPGRSILPEYLTYTLHAKRTEILELVSSAGSGTGVLDTGLLKRLSIWLPDLDEQKMIIQKIDDLELLIEILERLIAKKQAIKQGTMQQLLTGETRLPGFCVAWQPRRLSELLSYEQPGRFLVGTSRKLESGRIPVLTAGKTFVLGYTNETEGVYRAHPVIIFDDFTTASKFVDFDFKAKSSAMKILSARPGADLRFVYERIQLVDFPLGDHKRYWISEYSQQGFDVPDQDEQRAIASLLEDADREIERMKQRLAKAMAVKQGMMQELLTGRTRLPVEEARRE